MLTRKSKLLLTKIFSFFSVVRGYNIFVIALAQYLSAIFILAPERRALDILLDWRLFVLVIASTFAIASGYIINNFYDAKKDIINRPKKSYLDRLVSQKTQLRVYFILNFLSALLGYIISWRAALFYSVYIFLIWFYSHKLKKYPIIGNLTASLLAVLPFFGILLYFKNFYHVIFAHAIFLYLIILIREMVKDLENIEGDLSNNYQTIPVKYGENFAKRIISTLLFLTLIPVYFLINVYDVGYMDIYFYVSYILLLIFILKLWNSEGKIDYIKLHFLLKIILLAGVICIILIKPTVVENGQKLLLIR
ncbi:geranylgeranylglycerol-phosphate geranylgeranyltransferase [Flavobacterium urocaniciphilum]|uniref:4-hydroxybenzoate polyprenyltransferase n=1 Tax=Flavobacterium urocaniciphilum TaxID=1299341 RepID=A0A1H9AEM8_9FLAO|nr:geranylgeranylglycerol-phosphate geranylgeranyltransferase [Flavobacterium urocaniciphilum]SEP75140.1 4-hydroxybenzoate polyprenyltransferase [Flavobacterium urocaniciphilum]